MDHFILLQLLLMEVDEMENDFKWIHPKTVLIDHKLFTLYFRHIGFFDKKKIIINYNKFQNKCSYGLRVKKVLLLLMVLT